MKLSFPLLFLLVAPLSGCMLDPITMVGDTMTTAIMAAGPSDEERKAEDDARLLPILIAEDRTSSCDILTVVWPETRAYLLENSPVGAVAVQAREQVIAEKGCVIPSPRAQATAHAKPEAATVMNKQTAVAPASAVSVNPSAATTGSALSTNTLPPPSATPPATGRIGVRLMPVTPRTVSSYGLPSASGALVLGTIPGGGAERAGIQAGDVILGVSGKAIANPDELINAVAQASPGSSVDLRVWRYRSSIDVNVTTSPGSSKSPMITSSVPAPTAPEPTQKTAVQPATLSATSTSNYCFSSFTNELTGKEDSDPSGIITNIWKLEPTNTSPALNSMPELESYVRSQGHTFNVDSRTCQPPGAMDQCTTLGSKGFIDLRGYSLTTTCTKERQSAEAIRNSSIRQWPFMTVTSWAPAGSTQ